MGLLLVQFFQGVDDVGACAGRARYELLAHTDAFLQRFHELLLRLDRPVYTGGLGLFLKQLRLQRSNGRADSEQGRLRKHAVRGCALPSLTAVRPRQLLGALDLACCDHLGGRAPAHDFASQRRDCGALRGNFGLRVAGIHLDEHVAFLDA